ncbi:MAG: GntR family transcriptional regulator [Opitutaceae bacterium]|jgi:DNA-binding GntR family transcriptional regulator|nr:GntR family transcriptional regulator [Opitutaceae bacterium]
MNLSHDDFANSESFETSGVRLYRELQHEILTGKLHPGEHLIRRELCARFQLSQFTVTEALWRLENDGLVESAPMYGTRVCEISLDRTRNEHVLREALECQVARELAQVLHPDYEPRLLKLADKVDSAMRGGTGQLQESMELHRTFHMTLADLTTFPLLAREIALQWHRHLVLFNKISSRILPIPASWHRSLLIEIFSRDPERAEHAMRTHVRYGHSQQLQVVAEINRSLQAGESGNDADRTHADGSG